MAGSPWHEGDGEVRIVHEGARYVVIEKPPGMLSVPGKGPEKQDCAAARIRAMFPQASGPLVVHRLDMETSGLMVLGLDADAQRELSMQFELRQVEKAYVALLGEYVEGIALERAVAGAGGEASGARAGSDAIFAEHGVIDLPMRSDIDDRPRQIIDHVHGRAAVTRWQILAHEIDRVRVRLIPETGRTHQLRMHAAFGLGRPIVGDSLYGGAPAERLMLHATHLAFLEPGTVRRVTLQSDVPF